MIFPKKKRQKFLDDNSHSYVIEQHTAALCSPLVRSRGDPHAGVEHENYTSVAVETVTNSSRNPAFVPR